MKFLCVLVGLLAFGGATAQAQSKPAAAKPVAAAQPVAKPDPTRPVQVVEASCGQCRLGLAGHDCDLAVRIDGKAYYVDGTSIDEHGDAHAKDGFCQAIRKAEVQGTVVNNRFVATYFRVLPAPSAAR